MYRILFYWGKCLMTVVMNRVKTTVNCLTAKWPSANENENINTFSDVTITVGPSQLLAVVGHAGAGKV